MDFDGVGFIQHTLKKSCGGALILCTFVVLIQMLVAPVWAQIPSDSAPELVVLGNRAAQRGNYDLAVQAYTDAYQKSGDARLLYRIGQVFEAAGEELTAADYYQRYLDTAPETRFSERIESHIQSLRARRSTPLARLVVQTRPPRARIYVDNEFKSPSRVDVALPIGDYSVRVELEGYATWERTITLKLDQPVELDISLQPLEPSEPEPQAEAQSGSESTAPRPDDGAGSLPLPPLQLTHVDLAPNRFLQLLGWTSLIIGSWGTLATLVYMDDMPSEAALVLGSSTVGFAAGGATLLFVLGGIDGFQPARDPGVPEASTPGAESRDSFRRASPSANGLLDTSGWSMGLRFVF